MLKNKKLWVVFCLIFLSTWNFAQGQYAPWIELSKDAPNNLAGRNYPVPTKQEVGIPVYPGAVITSVSAPSEDTVKYDKQILPFVNLVSTDSPSKVIAFYKSRLTNDKGWNFSEEYSTFIKGETSSALTGFIPAVRIREENGNNFDLVYANEKLKTSLKTRIEVTYKPPDK